MMATPGYTVKMLSDMKTSVEKMTVQEHIEVLRIIKTNDNIKINENRNGVYINMSLLSPETITAIQTYITYLTERTQILETGETLKSGIEQFLS